MPSPIAETLIVNIPEVAANPIAEYFQGFKKYVESRESEKSKGLNFRFEVPISWSIQPGKHPNVLWTINNYEKTTTLTATVRTISKIYGIEANIIEDIDPKDLADLLFEPSTIEEKVVSMNPTNITHRRAVIANCHGSIFECDFNMTRLDFKIEGRMKAYYLLFDNYLLSIDCMILNNLSIEEKKIYLKYFDLIINSLIILNLYEE